MSEEHGHIPHLRKGLAANPDNHFNQEQCAEHQAHPKCHTHANQGHAANPENHCHEGHEHEGHEHPPKAHTHANQGHAANPDNHQQH